MEAEERFVERAIVRIFRFLQVIGLAGTVVASGLAGWRAGLGFLVGAAAAYLNFAWLHKMVEALTGGHPPSRLTMAFIALRYIVLGAGGYAIVKIFGLSTTAVLIGIFAPVAAVILEILYELFYARS